jgi:hypothetical protein
MVLKIKIGISRTLADSQQAENNHKIKQEFRTKSIKKRDGKAERGRICKLESRMVDHNNCFRGVVTVRGAETGQDVEISHRILMQAPTKGVN